MNWGFRRKKGKRQADRYLGLAVCVLFCVVTAGCRGTDRAIILGGEQINGTDDLAGAEVSGGVSGEVGPPGGAGMSGGAGLPENAGSQGGLSGGAGSQDGATENICVHVCGAVKAPGVVTLPEGSRAFDALQAAGGLTEEASETAVNLAEVLHDGMQLYFPTEDEAASPQWQTAKRQETEGGPVDINTADAALLCTLPGIGEARAADILKYREENGGFKSPEEIMKVPGIKEGAYAKIKDKITVR